MNGDLRRIFRQTRRSMGTAPKNVNGSNDDTKMKMKSEKNEKKMRLDDNGREAKRTYPKNPSWTDIGVGDT